MKDFISYITVGLVLWFFAVWLNNLHAEDIQVKEMTMKTETGEVVLTTEPCTFTKMGLTGYPYAAYATEKGHANHEGCWKVDVVDRYSAILVYFPEIDSTAVYNPKLFSPKKKVEPNTKLEPKLENNNVMIYGVYTF